MLPPPRDPGLPPAVNVMRHLGLEPDPWQADVLQSEHPRLLLNCARQAGKSTVVAVLALVHALFRSMSKVVILSRSQRQANELLRQIKFYHLVLGERLLERRTVSEIEFKNMSRIISLPCKEETIRGLAHVDILILDEAARVPDDLYRAVRPMLAVSKGRLICLSTPHGKRGFFWNAWAKGGADWHRIEIPATKCSRIAPSFLEEERRALGESWYRQEYECSFEALEGLVYPDFARCVVPKDSEAWQAALKLWDEKRAHWEQLTHSRPPWAWGGWGGGDSSQLEGVTCVGGIDFGFRNPFAAIWGLVDKDGVLWLVGEHYGQLKPLSWHAQHLPRQVTWYADPSGANECSELRCANFTVRRGINALRFGIAAIHGRLEAGTLKVLEGRCPNLLHEAGLYRFSDTPDDRACETPVDDHNHALGALRYLISRLDERKMARWGNTERRADGGAEGRDAQPGPPDGEDDECLWRRLAG
jgi:hypothetical protein